MALFLIGLALMAAGVVVGLADGGVPGSERLADALPAAGLAVMACAAALVATGRTPAFDEAARARLAVPGARVPRGPSWPPS